MTRYIYHLTFLWLAALLLISACGGTTAPPAADALATSPDGCVETYDPAVDYFPEKAVITHAQGWSIEYFNHYKVITVSNPWRDAETTFRYVLVQCGTPVPEGFTEEQVVTIPADSIIAMSTAYVSHLAALDLVERLVAVDSFAFVNTPRVVERIEAGELAEVGAGASLNVERVLELNPDLVMTYGIGDPQSDSYPQLLAAGVPTVINADYMETSPLGRAEWVKFTAAFFNHEAAAETHFNNVVSSYTDLADRVRDRAERPTVFAHTPYQGTWFMPGGNSFAAQFLADAGGNYLWSDDESSGSLQLSFEAVYERAADADVWVMANDWQDIEAVLAADERFANFAALQQGNVYNNNARVNEHGGNDYWETGVTNPHLVLADLIAIFHPDVLPDHELYFYRRLPE